MTPKGNQDPPKQDIKIVLAEFESKKQSLTTFCDRTRDLIEQILLEANIPFQSVQSRVKSKEKLKQKYLDPEKNYTQLADITDQAGLRVITYYEDEVDNVVEKLKQEFDIDEKNSVDRRETEPDKFGYYALNYVCKYPSRRTSQLEYKKFADVWCEIQVTSILRHAWSEIEHPWYDLKRAYPDDIRRRFARMAALMEIAEREFLDLRKIRSDYQRSLDVRVAANVPNIPVDAVSLRSFIEHEPLVAKIDKSLSAIIRRDISGSYSDQSLSTITKAAHFAGLETLQQIEEYLKKHESDVPRFVSRCMEEIWSAPFDTDLPPGVSIYQLTQLLLSNRGVAALSEFLETLKVKHNVDLSRQALIAREIIGAN